MELELQRDDIVSSYDQKLRDSNRALAEIQEAYKEKLRKCQAWEKVRKCHHTKYHIYSIQPLFSGLQQCQKPAF